MARHECRDQTRVLEEARQPSVRKAPLSGRSQGAQLQLLLWELPEAASSYLLFVICPLLYWITSLTPPDLYTQRQHSSLKKRQLAPFSAVSISSPPPPVLYITVARESISSGTCLDNCWLKVTYEAMPPIPAIIPNPINNGMNWMSLFGQMCATRGKANVWLLGGGGRVCPYQEWKSQGVGTCPVIR